MGRSERLDHDPGRLQHRRQPGDHAVVKEKKVPFFAIGAAGASLTGKDCTPYTIHYAYDTVALANGTAKTILKQGGKSWFFSPPTTHSVRSCKTPLATSSRRPAHGGRRSAGAARHV